MPAACALCSASALTLAVPIAERLLVKHCGGAELRLAMGECTILVRFVKQITVLQPENIPKIAPDNFISCN